MSETTAGGLLWEALENDDARKRQFITQVRRAAELSRENENLTARLAAAEEDRNKYKRLYDLRGKALMHPCLQCGYQPKVISWEANGGKHGQ